MSGPPAIHTCWASYRVWTHALQFPPKNKAHSKDATDGPEDMNVHANISEGFLNADWFCQVVDAMIPSTNLRQTPLIVHLNSNTDSGGGAIPSQTFFGHLCLKRFGERLSLVIWGSRDGDRIHQYTIAGKTAARRLMSMCGTGYQGYENLMIQTNIIN